MGDIGPTRQRYEVLPADPLTPTPAAAEPVIETVIEPVDEREPVRTRA